MQASGGTGTPERERWKNVEELCDRYLGGRPSEAALQVLRNAEQQRPEVRDFVERAFRLMALSKFDPRDFSPFVARFFTVIAPGILPGAWGGIVPPFTLRGIGKSMPICARMNGRTSSQGRSCWMWDAGFLLRLPLKRRRRFRNGESLARIRLLNNISCTTNARTMHVSTGREECGIFKPAARKSFSPCTPIGTLRFSIFRRRSHNCSPVFPPMREHYPLRNTTAGVWSAIL